MSLFSAQKISDPKSRTLPDDSPPLPVDVFRKGDKLVILSPVAGVTIDDISVSITEDILTIKGNRQWEEEIQVADVFSQECYWGEFSRSIVLPVQVDIEKVAAFYKNGILRIEMPISADDRSRVIPILVDGE